VDDVRPIVLHEQVQRPPVSPQVSPPQDDSVKAGQVPHVPMPLQPERRFDGFESPRQPEFFRHAPEIDVDRRQLELGKRRADEPEVEAGPVRYR